MISHVYCNYLNYSPSCVEGEEWKGGTPFLGFLVEKTGVAVNGTLLLFSSAALISILGHSARLLKHKHKTDAMEASLARLSRKMEAFALLEYADIVLACTVGEGLSAVFVCSDKLEQESSPSKRTPLLFYAPRSS